MSKDNDNVVDFGAGAIPPLPNTESVLMLLTAMLALLREEMEEFDGEMLSLLKHKKDADPYEVQKSIGKWHAQCEKLQEVAETELHKVRGLIPRED